MKIASRFDNQLPSRPLYCADVRALQFDVAVASTETKGETAAMAAVRSGVVALPAGDSKVSMQITASASQIKLWWPNGMGEQPLYNVTATWTPTPTLTPTIGNSNGSNRGTVDQAAPAATASAAAVSAVRRIGFRVFALVTTNDTNATHVAANADTDGSDNHGMFFRVNGAAMYSRGANMVPMDELEGRLSGEAHRILVKSSADAGMNTLRVWGGGIFFPREFYEACDDYGVLLYVRHIIDDSLMTHSLHFLVTGTLVVMESAAPHQCPVSLVGSCRIYADLCTF